MAQDVEHIYNNASFYHWTTVTDSSTTGLFQYPHFLTQRPIAHKMNETPVKSVPDSVFWILLLPILYLFWSSLRQQKKIRSILECFTYVSALKKGENIKMVFSSFSWILFGFSFLMSIVFLVNLSSTTNSFFLNTFQIVVLLFLLLISKFVLFYFAGFLLNKSNDLKICVYYYANMLSVWGVLLVPTLMICIYANISFLKQPMVALWFGLTPLVLSYLYGIFNMANFIKKSNIAQNFHIILYLCTFEILPGLIAGKYLVTHKIIAF
jgi:hypothetical protein